MKRKPLLVASLFLAWLTGCNPSDKKVTYNLDVEELSITKRLPVDWGLDNVVGEGMPEDSTLQALSADSVVKQHGRYSLCMDWKARYGEWTCCSYAITKRFKGKAIKLTGYLKTDGATAGAGLWMRIDGTDGQFLQFDNMQDRKVMGTTDWKQYTVELPYDGEHSSGIVAGGTDIWTGQGVDGQPTNNY
ncbi:MAG: hypothetical protein KF744_02405 [Taibaiella sp.]|nr:hypothetical protein [Taibaiella sp.]